MSDYLWDKTGEPDEEVERLEKLLGGLAHRPRALELPPDARVERAPRTFRRRPALAAAAALALMLLAGAWLVASRLRGDVPRAAQDPRADAPRIVEGAHGDGNAAAPRAGKNDARAPSPKKEAGPVEQASEKRESAERHGRQQSGQRWSAEQGRRRGALRADAGSGVKRRGGTERGPRAARPQGGLVASVARQQQSAKEQLMYALRLTGAKLSEVRTKVRGAGEGSPAPEGPNRIR